MKKHIFLSLAALALTVLLSLGISNNKPRDAGALTAKPNIVFILTDDMRKDDLQYMPKTRALLQDRGMSFSNAFVSNALCCPARATIMRGQYTHNTGVWKNTNSTTGGLQAYKDHGGETDNVATRLDAAGYRTALFGKYLNGYTDTTGKPPGWDRWFAHVYAANYYDYKINDDGTLRQYAFTSADYETDVIADHAKTFIDASAKSSVPFFAYVAPMAPHVPATPAPRDLHTYDGLKAPRPPSFNEADVSDKSSWIKQKSKLSSSQISAINTRHEKRAESLQAVDDLVEGIVGGLEKTGAMCNTYVFFTSDNGWHEGEHRIPENKWRPYEEDIRMPLLVRGPGVAAGSTTDKLALNTDYLPTFTDLACPSSSACDTQDTQNWTYVPDGRSLRPVLEGNASPWRNAILLEGAQNNVYVPKSPAYRGIRTTGPERKYVEYEGTEREVYYLGADPYELTNRYDASAPPADLVSRLKDLQTCKGDGCRVAENGQEQDTGG